MKQIINMNRGPCFPFRFEDGEVRCTGGSAYAAPLSSDADESARSGVLDVLMTGAQERVMLAQYGVGAERWLFHSMGPLANGFVESAIRQQMDMWCPRSQVSEVKAEIDSINGEVVIELGFVHNDAAQESILKVRVGSPA